MPSEKRRQSNRNCKRYALRLSPAFSLPPQAPVRFSCRISADPNASFLCPWIVQFQCERNSKMDFQKTVRQPTLKRGCKKLLRECGHRQRPCWSVAGKPSREQARQKIKNNPSNAGGAVRLREPHSFGCGFSV